MIIVDIKKLIHRIAHAYPGGLRQLAADMGINYNTLRSKANANIDTHYFSGDELALLADLANTDEVAEYFADRRGLMCIKKPDFESLSDKEILDLFLDLQAKQGEWAREISKSMENGDIDWNELVAIRKEYDEFITAAAEVMNRLQSFMAVSEENKMKRNK